MSWSQERIQCQGPTGWAGPVRVKVMIRVWVKFWVMVKVSQDRGGEDYVMGTEIISSQGQVGQVGSVSK